MTVTTTKATRSLYETLKHDLQNPEFAIGVLDDALADKDIPGFLELLRDIVRADAGMTRVAESTGLARESLYIALSRQGNPSLGAVAKVLDTLGYRLSIVEKAATTQEAS